MSNKKRWEWLKYEEMGSGKMGGLGMVFRIWVLKALYPPCAVMLIGGKGLDKDLCKECGGFPGDGESWLAPGESSW